MASYHEARKNGKFMGAYVCSKCKSVIMRDFTFHAVAYSRWTQKKAVEAVEAAAERGLKALTDFKDKPFAVNCEVEDRSYSLVSGFQFSGLERGCPYCGNKERWQFGPEIVNGLPKDAESGVTLVTDVPLRSRLVTVTTPEEMQKVHSAMVALVTEECKLHWAQHQEEAASVCLQIKEIKEQIEEVTARKASAGTGSASIFGQMKQKEEQMKGLSMFSGERKTLKAELKELEKQYNAQKAADIQQEAQLTVKIETLQKQLKELLIRNPGVLAEHEQVSPKDTQALAAIRYN